MFYVLNQETNKLLSTKSGDLIVIVNEQVAANYAQRATDYGDKHVIVQISSLTSHYGRTIAPWLR